MNAKTIIEELNCIQCDGSGAIPVTEDDFEQCQFCYEIRFPFIEETSRRLEADLLAKLPEDLDKITTEYDTSFRQGYNQAITEMTEIIRQYFGGGE